MFPSFKKYYNTELNGMYDYNIDKAKELINSLSGVEAIFVTDDYSIITTSDEYNVSKE